MLASPHEGRAARELGGASPSPSAGTRVAKTNAAAFAVSPLVNARVRKFVARSNDLRRSAVLGRVVVPLVVLLLIEAELLAAAGRSQGRALRAFAVPLITLFVMLAVVRIRAYRG